MLHPGKRLVGDGTSRARGRAFRTASGLHSRRHLVLTLVLLFGAYAREDGVLNAIADSRSASHHWALRI
jgi:hypothetical protein